MDELESSKAVLLLRLALTGSALQRGHHTRQLGLLLLLAGCSALRQQGHDFKDVAVLHTLTGGTEEQARPVCPPCSAVGPTTGCCQGLAGTHPDHRHALLRPVPASHCASVHSAGYLQAQRTLLLAL